MPKVRTATARCDHCGLVMEGELLHGSTCRRCETGRMVNTALLAENERPWDESDEEGT